LKEKGLLWGFPPLQVTVDCPEEAVIASKFAMNGWLEAIRTELMEDDVHVMWVCPGFTRSNIRNAALNSKAKHRVKARWMKGLMSPEECAEHILKAIEKKKTNTGTHI
jgi:short-subunit dehydrogenase